MFGDSYVSSETPLLICFGWATLGHFLGTSGKTVHDKVFIKHMITWLMHKVSDMFTDTTIISKIRNKMPYLFRIAEIEASRGGRVGMEIGSVRERIIIALLRYYFGKDNVSDDLPITEAETDVVLFGNPISIKTKTGVSFAGIKSVWTVDWDKIDKFVKSYTPKADMILARIVWDAEDGGFYHIPVAVQDRIFNRLGSGGYLKVPPRGTNPRGVEYSPEAIRGMIADSGTRRIKINWQRRTDEKIDVYEKWERYWSED